ncbi:winged helix-turn-helix transcriptional regulator [Nitrosopumilus sp.]
MYFTKQTRFSQFVESIDEINTKTLSLRLKEMEQSGYSKTNQASL